MNWFRNLKTRSKLTLSFSLIIVLLLVIIGTAWYSLESVYRAQSGLTDLVSVRNNLNAQRAAMLSALLLTEGASAEKYLTEIANNSQENANLLRDLEERYRGDQRLNSYIGQLQSIRASFLQLRDEQVIPLIREQKQSEATPIVTGPQADLLDKFRAVARDFTDHVSARSDAQLASAKFIFVLLGVGALLAAVAVTVGLSRSIAGPLEEITAAADRIADGDIDVEPNAEDRHDEIGKLMQTFRRMCQSLKVLAGRARQIADGDLTAQIKPRSERDVLGNAFAGMVNELRRLMQELLDAVNVLASSASEIMASTTQLAASAAETATAVTETTATVEEVKQTSQVSSQKAKYVSEEAQKSAEIANTGRTAVNETIDGMNSIRQQMSAVADSILNLSAQGQAIGEIISTVDDLAAQSKLLAVNASIEAAKAGEEGKGFAVVAQEVRSLAEQSKQATTQVRGILTDIQKATSSAVLATEQGGKAVESGVKQSTSSGESIRALAESIAQAAHASTQIAATSQQQFVGMDQVAMAMENIKTASTQTVASTKQAEVAARQLHDLGQKLKQLVARFKI